MNVETRAATIIGTAIAHAIVIGTEIGTEIGTVTGEPISRRVSIPIREATPIRGAFRTVGMAATVDMAAAATISSEATMTDWTEVRRMPATAGLSTRTTQAIFGLATQLTVMDSVADTRSVIDSSAAAIGDGSRLE